MREATGTLGMFQEAQRSIVDPLLLGAGKREGEKKTERNKIITNVFSQATTTTTFRIRTGGQKLFHLAQPFLSSLPSLRSFHKFPEEDSTGVNTLTPLPLGGNGDIADLNQLRL